MVQIGAEGSHCHKVMSENFRCLGVLLNNVQLEEPNLALFVQFVGCKEVKDRVVQVEQTGAAPAAHERVTMYRLQSIMQM